MRKMLITLLLLIAVLLAIPQTADAIGEPTVTISFDENSVEVGDSVTVTYQVSGEGNYTGVSYNWFINTESLMFTSVRFSALHQLRKLLSVRV